MLSFHPFHSLLPIVLLFTAVGIVAPRALGAASDLPRERLSLDADWRFQKDDPPGVGTSLGYDTMRPWLLSSANAFTTWRKLLGGTQYGESFARFVGEIVSPGTVVWIWAPQQQRRCRRDLPHGLRLCGGETRQAKFDFRLALGEGIIGPADIYAQ